MTVSHPAGTERFVLQGLDPETGSVKVEKLVFIADTVAVKQVIGCDADEDPDWLCSYDLEPNELAAIGELCRPAFVADPVFTRFERWSSLNEIPYLVHTGFELPLMLDGRKPLAIFGDAYPSAWFDEYLAPFDPFVRSGAVVRRIIDEPMPKKARRPEWDCMRNVYFVLPGQEWRIDAYIEMYEAGRRSGWDDDFERQQGSLLGYEDWQNDWWLKHRRDIRRG
ncbi:MAG: hypothetical protein V4475_17085 [Pseudomonadota bacterium]